MCVNYGGRAEIADAAAAIARDVPGVTVGTGENGNAFGDRFIIRGQEVRSDVFVDGLRDPGMTTRESFAVEQIEITKGPSASFGGRGTTGGSVNSITKQASSDYDFQRVDLGIGTDDYLRGTADAVDDHALGLLGPHPVHDGDPLALLQILVVLEEVRDLRGGGFRQVARRLYGAIQRREFVHRYRQQFGVVAGVVFHRRWRDAIS